jgi:hypothetical protein
VSFKPSGIAKGGFAQQGLQFDIEEFASRLNRPGWAGSNVREEAEDHPAEDIAVEYSGAFQCQNTKLAITSMWSFPTM